MVAGYPRSVRRRCRCERGSARRETPRPVLRSISAMADVSDRDGPRDECGVFGLYAPDPEHEVSKLAYFALYALQHRGQESAGIATADVGGHIMTLRELGLVNQVFDEQKLRARSEERRVGKECSSR